MKTKNRFRNSMAALVVAALATGVVTAPTAVAQDKTCVASGTATWGYKDSFLKYIQGKIANGKITTEGGATFAATKGPFSFPVNAEKSTIDNATTGTLALDGTVNFKGHYSKESYGGWGLDMTLSDLKIKVNGGAGQIIADYQSQEFDFGTMKVGEKISADDAVLVDIKFAKAPNLTSGTVDLTGTTTVAKGMEVLGVGQYELGEEVYPTGGTVTTKKCEAATPTTSAKPSTTAAPSTSAKPSTTAPKPSTTATSTTKPAATSTTKPAETSTSKPAATSTTKPAETSTSKPAATSTTKPETPGASSSGRDIPGFVKILAGLGIIGGIIAGIFGFLQSSNIPLPFRF